ncbi:hypothetical protein H9Q09_00965 [Aurantimonas sp. DM33-3]|uniref:hypothetical protein n=1 Tax=Aurantimonas sp. DM33-3 TaxID=2766955 RepID=UPI001651BE86|nr:hypothetical protein [Aurantimonas sp. DM33-3]MBC6714755.1 hypothetical protein [Aurantimonas sp. DM33-3]
MADKPASRPIAKALARGDRFVGQFALAGFVPELVKVGGQVARFDTAEEAEGAAQRALSAKLTHRRVESKRKGEYTRMTGEELAVALRTAELNPHSFALLYGVPQARIVKWLDDEQEIPHVAAVVIGLLQDPKNRAIAKAITDKAMKEE